MRRTIILPTLLLLAASVCGAQNVDITNALYPERYPQEQQDALNGIEREDTTHHAGDDIVITSPLVLKYMHQRDSIEAVENNPYVQLATNTTSVPSTPKSPSSLSTPGSPAILVTRTPAVPKLMDDPERARIVEAAVGGDMEAQYQLGRIYDEGKGIPRNSKEAAYWYRRAARNGHTEALLALGKAFKSGEGVLQDNRIAAENFWRAAERGNAEGAYLFATMLQNGEGVERDLPRALKYYMQAAEADYRDAGEKASGLRAQGIRLPSQRASRGAVARAGSHGGNSKSAATRRKSNNKRRR